jgi:putative membrane protein
MLWVKSFHILFVMSWMAAVFYLPRILVNLAMVEPKSHAERERLLLMARKLLRFAYLLMIPTWIFGLWLWLGYGITGGWLHAKLVLVVLLMGYQHGCGVLLKKFEMAQNKRSHRFFRIYNEVSVLMALGVIVLVVVKPF